MRQPNIVNAICFILLVLERRYRFPTFQRSGPLPALCDFATWLELSGRSLCDQDFDRFRIGNQALRDLRHDLAGHSSLDTALVRSIFAFEIARFTGVLGQIRCEELFRGGQCPPCHLQSRAHNEISFHDVDVTVNVLCLVSSRLFVVNLFGPGLLIFLLGAIFPCAIIRIFGNFRVKLCLWGGGRYSQRWVEFDERCFKLALNLCSKRGVVRRSGFDDNV